LLLYEKRARGRVAAISDQNAIIFSICAATFALLTMLLGLLC
jgi:hypothetical protein